MFVKFGLILSLTIAPLAAYANDLQGKKQTPNLSLKSNDQTDWSGFYIGGRLSFNHLANYQTYDFNGVVAPFIFSQSNGHKTVTGLQAGYDEQVGEFVIGINASLDFSNLRVIDKLGAPYGTLACDDIEPLFETPTICPDDVKTSLNSLSTFSARVGYLFQQQLLFYMKGGLSLARFEYEHDTKQSFSGFAKDTRTGLNIGGGIEYLVNTNWSVFVEYNRVDFGKKITSFDYPAVPIRYDWENDNILDIFTFGLNYQL